MENYLTVTIFFLPNYSYIKKEHAGSKKFNLSSRCMVANHQGVKDGASEKGGDRNGSASCFPSLNSLNATGERIVS